MGGKNFTLRVWDEAAGVDLDAMRKGNPPLLGDCKKCGKQIEIKTFTGKDISVTVIACPCEEKA